MCVLKCDQHYTIQTNKSNCGIIELFVCYQVHQLYIVLSKKRDPITQASFLDHISEVSLFTVLVDLEYSVGKREGKGFLLCKTSECSSPLSLPYYLPCIAMYCGCLPLLYGIYIFYVKFTKDLNPVACTYVA